MLTTPPTEGILGSFIGLVMLSAWGLLPIAIYKDATIATVYTPNWFPHVWLYVLGAVIPFVNIIVSGVYLYQRWRYGRETAADIPETNPE